VQRRKDQEVQRGKDPEVQKRKDQEVQREKNQQVVKGRDPDRMKRADQDLFPGNGQGPSLNLNRVISPCLGKNPGLGPAVVMLDLHPPCLKMPFLQPLP